MITIRPAQRADHDALWSIIEPVLRAGETYTLPREMNREAALAFWFAPAHQAFVAAADGRVLGTYFLRANQGGGGSHVANCGYMTAADAQGRGIGRAMLRHSLAHARLSGFRAMQFNFVVSSNTRALETWLAHGFEVVGRLPGAFHHPALGFVDALVLFRQLTEADAADQK